jgi:signal transduction histidine kinase
MDAWLARMYELNGPRYIAIAPIAVLGVVVVTILPVGGLLAAHYEELSLTQFVFAIGACSLAGLPVCIGTYLVVRGDIGYLRRWAGGERGEALRQEALVASFTAHRKACIAAIVLSLIFVAPTAVLAVSLPTDHDTPMDFIELAAGAAALIVLASIAGYAMHELTLRPVRAELAGTRLGDFRFESLATRLTAMLLLTIFLATSLGNTLSVQRAESGAGSLLEAGAFGGAITLVFALLLGPILSGSLLGPIRSLIEGHRQVGSGNLDTSVAVTTQDELGELTESFNEMVVGLRERDRLREHNVTLVDELRASQVRLVAASSEARRRVERDLHDGAQQSLVLASLKLASAARQLERDPDATRAFLDEARADLDRGLGELRDLARGIYPASLSSDGLGTALGELVDRAPVSARLECDSLGRYPAEIEAAVYFCCLEALQNASKHAGDGAHVTVRLSANEPGVQFEVADDGAGFDTAKPTAQGTGLANMGDRVRAFGGDLKVESKPGSGTRVRGHVPAEPVRMS